VTGEHRELRAAAPRRPRDHADSQRRPVGRPGTRSSYTYQLGDLRVRAPLPIDADDAVATMQLIDDCYRLAGFQPGRGRRR
jgi:hypothetical protein